MVPFSHRMRWLSHVRLPGEPGLWRIGLAQERIASIQPMPPGSAAAGEHWQGD